MGLIIYGQKFNHNYKNFTDTIFVKDDKILAPEIHFTLSGGSRALTNHYDSIKVIADFLTKHPEINIEIGVHTDSRGSINPNLKTSEYRAKSVRNELLNRFGINPKRIETKGYGESDPLIKVNEIEQVDSELKKEELHRQNRRIELMIVE